MFEAAAAAAAREPRYFGPSLVTETTYKELQTKIADLQPDVWAVAPNRRYAANKCLQGYEFIPMQSWDLNFSNFHWDCKAE